MMVVEKGTPAMFDDVYPLLSELDGSYSREKWREIFDYQWESDEGYVGYALVDGRKVVGFNGAIFSRRIIDGREARVCNLTSWIVDRKSTRLNSSHLGISYAVFCLKKKKSKY